jgi:hypothetical protein
LWYRERRLALKGKWPALKGKWPALKGKWPALKSELPALKEELPALKGELPALKEEWFRPSVFHGFALLFKINLFGFSGIKAFVN